MSEHQKETASLRHSALYDASAERLKLEQSIAQVHRDQRCIHRVASVAALFLLLLVAGFAYGAILPGSFPYSLSEVVFNLVCVLGLASLICLVAFAGLLAVYCVKLNRLRENRRRLTNTPPEPQLSKPHIATLPDSQRVSDDREAFDGAVQASD